jgi:putative SOS response-associated peptidase YedK
LQGNTQIETKAESGACVCVQFVAVPKEVVEDIIRDIEAGLIRNAGTGFAGLSVFPKSEAALIVPNNGRLSVQTMRWGYDVSWSKQVVFNTRFETATRPGRNMWADSLAHRRCLVPTLGFFENHQSETFLNPRTGKANRQKYFFAAPFQSMLFIAGIYEKDCFSIMTTEPNDIVRPIHNRMPLVMQPEELSTWLFGDYLSLADRSALQLTAARE